MSRVGKVPVKIHQGVKVDIKDGVVKVEGPKGKLCHKLPRGVAAKVENGAIVLVPRDEDSSERLGSSGPDPNFDPQHGSWRSCRLHSGTRHRRRRLSRGGQGQRAHA